MAIIKKRDSSLKEQISQMNEEIQREKSKQNEYINKANLELNNLNSEIKSLKKQQSKEKQDYMLLKKNEILIVSIICAMISMIILGTSFVNIIIGLNLPIIFYYLFSLNNKTIKEINIVLNGLNKNKIEIEKIKNYHREQLIQTTLLKSTEINNLIKGLEGENKVTEQIEKKLSNDYILLNDITIPTKTKIGTTQIDHILIHGNDIITIETKNISGKYYPAGKEWKWTPYNKGKYVKKDYMIYSPQAQSIEHQKHLTTFLNENGFNKNIYCLVVLVDKNSEFKGDFYEQCPVLKIENLIKFIRENLDIQAINKQDDIQDLLRILEESDRIYSSQHTENMKRIQKEKELEEKSIEPNKSTSKEWNITNSKTTEHSSLKKETTLRPSAVLGGVLVGILLFLLYMYMKGFINFLL